MTGRRIGRAGQSIIEILVAMVILLIGIFGIIRIFPTGFGVILYGENVSLAQRLAHGALEKARSNAENLPDAIAPVLPEPNDPTGVVLDATLTPAVEAHDFAQEPFPADQRERLHGETQPGQLSLSQIGFNRTRRVFGETTKIPPPTPNLLYMPATTDSQGRSARELVSVYTVQHGPISIAKRPVIYSGQPLERQIFTEDPSQEDADRLGPTRYGVSYQNRNRLSLYFDPRPYPRVYKIQYSYVLSTTSGPFRAQSLPDEIFTLPAGQFKAEIPMPNGAVVEPGEEQVARAFTELALNQPFSDFDPYQFKLLNQFVGLIGFNPLASMARRRGGSGRALTAKIDYDVEDWHIISEDRTIPSEAPYRVKLTLNFIKQAGEVQANQEVYRSLAPAVANLGIDVLVVDLDTGKTMDSRTLRGSENGSIDYRTGTIQFNQTVRWSLPPNGQLGPAEPIGGQTIRIYYRTDDDFGLHVQKAFTSYLRSALPQAVTPGQYGQLTGGFLVFPASDHHQSVLVDYSFTRLVGKDEQRLTVSGELQPIRDPVTDPASPRNLGAMPAPRPTDWFIRLNNSPRIGNNDSTGRPEIVPGSIVVHAVRGVSVRSRVAWRQGTRWRRVENSTYLTRQGT